MYRESIGGTLVEEFKVVWRGSSHGARFLDGLIIPHWPHGIFPQDTVNISGQDVIVVQTKAQRLTMSLMWQTLFSARLIEELLTPASVQAVAICTQDDSVLRPLLEFYDNMSVVILPSV